MVSASPSGQLTHCFRRNQAQQPRHESLHADKPSPVSISDTRLFGGLCHTPSIRQYPLNPRLHLGPPQITAETSSTTENRFCILSVACEHSVAQSVSIVIGADGAFRFEASRRLRTQASHQTSDPNTRSSSNPRLAESCFGSDERLPGTTSDQPAVFRTQVASASFSSV